MKHAYEIILFAALTLTSSACNVLEPDYTRCELAPTTNTGDLSRDILGTWSCIRTVDSIVPLCDFREDGTLRMVTPLMSDEALSTSQGSMYPNGSVVMWRYEVGEDDTLTLYDEDGSTNDEDGDLRRVNMTEFRLEFESGIYWNRYECSGFGFESD